jgi:hypothetical protein
LPGRDAQVVERFAKDLQAHGGCADAITEEVSMDLSLAFQKGATEMTIDNGQAGPASRKPDLDIGCC